MQLRSTGLAALTLAALVSVFSACTKEKKDDGLMTFSRALRDDIKTLDPANAYDTVSLDVLPNIVETLYQYDYASSVFKLIPQLAADMPKYSKDRLTVTIPIKKGVVYADDAAFKETQGKGREMVAGDFLFAFKRLAHPKVLSQGSWIFEGRVKGFKEFSEKLRNAPSEKVEELFNAENIEGFTAPDPYTIQIQLTKPYPQLLYMMAMNFTSPVPPEAVATYADERKQLNDHPIGTGAFILAKWDRGHEVVLKRNPTFHGNLMPAGFGPDSGKALPFLDRVIFTIIKEDQPAWLNFLKGDLDIAGIPKDSYAQAIDGGKGRNLTKVFQDRSIKLDVVPGPVAYWLSFNVQDPVLKNKVLRQALSSAVNRDQWIELFTNGRGKKQVTVSPPGLLDRVEDSKIKYDFNIARGKELLKKAGYPDGKGLPTITMDMRGADSVNRQMGEFFTQQLRQIGVKIDVVFNTFPAYLEKSKKGQLQMSYGGWFLDYPDVENMYQLLYGPNAAPGPNEFGFNDPKFNSMYEKLSVMDLGPERAKLVRAMDELVQEEVPWGLGFYRDEFTLVQGWVLNYHANPFVKDGLKYYRVDPLVKKELLKKFKQ